MKWEFKSEINYSDYVKSDVKLEAKEVIVQLELNK